MLTKYFCLFDAIGTEITLPLCQNIRYIVFWSIKWHHQVSLQGFDSLMSHWAEWLNKQISLVSLHITLLPHFHFKVFFFLWFVLVNFTGIHKCLSHILHTSCMMNYNKVSVSFLLPPQNAPRQKERVKRHASYTQEIALNEQDIYSCGYADGGRRHTFDCLLSCISQQHCCSIFRCSIMYSRHVFGWFIFSLILCLISI